MGELIGDSANYSTWGRCRTPIFNSTVGISIINAHNYVATDGFFPANGGLFRCSAWVSQYTWIDGGGTTQTAYVGTIGNAFNQAGPPATGFFWVGASNADPAEAYGPNNLDDVEVQAYWVGRDVVLDSGTNAMAYAGLNGVNGSFQSVGGTTTTIVSFDL